MRKRYPDEYNSIYNPVLNRRQRIALDAFFMLNRDRDYTSTGSYLKPLNIKTGTIKAYFETLTKPIDFGVFKMLIQHLDDVFIDFSAEQVANGRT